MATKKKKKLFIIIDAITQEVWGLDDTLHETLEDARSTLQDALEEDDKDVTLHYTVLEVSIEKEHHPELKQYVDFSE